MRTIYRYEVPLFDTVAFDLTSDPLHVAENPNGNLEFWAEYDQYEIHETRKFTVVGTGHPIQPGMKYVGTAPRTKQGLVFHLYEVS